MECRQRVLAVRVGPPGLKRPLRLVGTCRWALLVGCQTQPCVWRAASDHTKTVGSAALSRRHKDTEPCGTGRSLEQGLTAESSASDICLLQIVIAPNGLSAHQKATGSMQVCGGWAALPGALAVPPPRRRRTATVTAARRKYIGGGEACKLITGYCIPCCY